MRETEHVANVGKLDPSAFHSGTTARSCRPLRSRTKFKDVEIFRDVLENKSSLVPVLAGGRCSVKEGQNILLRALFPVAGRLSGSTGGSKEQFELTKASMVGWRTAWFSDI